MSEISMEDTFEAATSEVTSLAGTLSNEELLYFYARYKQVTEGPCTTNRPSFLMMKAKQKWGAWKSLGSMPKEVAMQQYITKLSDIKPEWQQVTSKSIYGPCVSCPIKNEKIDECDKTLFDHVRDANLERIRQASTSELLIADSNNLTLLHWACDLGHLDIAEYLINQNVDIDCLDSDGQTPLHYASSCYNIECVKLLLSKGARHDILDNDGMSALDVAADSDIQSYIKKYVNL